MPALKVIGFSVTPTKIKVPLGFNKEKYWSQTKSPLTVLRMKSSLSSLSSWSLVNSLLFQNSWAPKDLASSSLFYENMCCQYMCDLLNIGQPITYRIGRNSYDVTTPGSCKLKGQVPKATNSNNADTMGGWNIVVVEGRENSGTSTHERSSMLCFDIFGYFVAKSGVEHRLVSESSQSFREANSLGTQNFVSGRALLAIQARRLQVTEAIAITGNQQ